MIDVSPDLLAYRAVKILMSRLPDVKFEDLHKYVPSLGEECRSEALRQLEAEKKAEA